MSIYTKFINASITLIERPTRSGVGGDVVLETLLYGPISATRSPFNAFATAGDILSREPDVESIAADNSFFIDLVDASGVVRRLEPDDLVTWTSLTTGGPSTGSTKDEILRVNIWDMPTPLFERGHVELVTRGAV